MELLLTIKILPWFGNFTIHYLDIVNLVEQT
jgi:hypothetical protein